MAENQTADQARDGYVRMLGPKLGSLYHALASEITWLHVKWNQHRTLFADSSERVELLNTVAGFFFRVIEDVLWQDVVLHIARLMDPPNSGEGKDNLTLLQLEEAVAQKAPELSPEIADLLAHAQKETGFAKDWRNRLIAHRDLRLALDAQAMPLPEISRDSTERALAAVSSVLNRIANHFWHGETAFALTITPGDAEHLLYHLKVAVDAEDKELRDLGVQT